MPKNNKIESVIIGEKYGRLKIISFHHSDKRWRKWYECSCDCGNNKIIMGSAIVSGNTRSCGCLSKEVQRAKRISYNHSEVTAIMLSYKRHAIRRGFCWELSRMFVENLINKNCYYCGSEPMNIKKTKNSLGEGLLYSGIDRIDSLKGYTENNVVPCCKICNYAKSNMTTQEFYIWAKRLNAMADQWG